MIVIDSGYFYAAVVLGWGRVVRCAPVLKYMRGWSVEHVVTYARSRGWSVLIWEN